MSEVFYNAKNLTISNGFLKNPNRYYLEEWFKQRPAINADIDQAYTVEVARAANKDFEVLGTNASTDDITFSTDGGITLETDGADNDQIIILPHTDTNQSNWNSVNWSTSKEIEWSCAIKTDSSIADIGIWAGLRTITGVGAAAAAYTEDNNQAMFLFATNDDLGSLSTNANLHFIYSIGGTDYVTDLGIAFSASTIYRLKISIDSAKQISVFVNDKQYGLTNSNGTSGTTESTNTTKSKIMNSVNLKPYVGVQALTGSAKKIHLYYEKISKVL